MSRRSDEGPPRVPLPATFQTVALRRCPVASVARARALFGGAFAGRAVDHPPLVVLSDPDDIRDVLRAPADTLHPGEGAGALRPMLGGHSFIVADEEAHLAVRGALAESFSKGAAARGEAGVIEEARREVASWPMDEPVALHPRLRAFAARVILRTVLSDSPERQAMLRPLLDMSSTSNSFVVQEQRLRHLPGWRGTWRRIQASRAELTALIAALIARRRRLRKSSSDVLDVLLAAPGPDGAALADEQVIDSLVSLMLAGHETTAAALAWAFELLARNGEVQQRVAAAVNSGDEAYVTATINEILRCGPVFLFAIPRAVVRPIAIGRYRYSPPALLLASTYMMHTDPRLYIDPQAFRPERFLDSQPDASVWMPWGRGLRQCLGRHLAVTEVRAVLTETLATRRVAPVGRRAPRACWRSAILAPSDRSRLLLHPRHPAST